MGYNKAAGTTLPRSFLRLRSVWEYSRLDQESLGGHRGQVFLEHLGDQLGQSSQEVLPNQLHPRCKRQHGLISIGAPNDLLTYAAAAARMSQSKGDSMKNTQNFLFIDFPTAPYPLRTEDKSPNSSTFQPCLFLLISSRKPLFGCELSGAGSFPGFDPGR